MLTVSPDLHAELAEARHLMLPGRIVLLYSRLRTHFPELSPDASVPEMMSALVALGGFGVECRPVTVSV